MAHERRKSSRLDPQLVVAKEASKVLVIVHSREPILWEAPGIVCFIQNLFGRDKIGGTKALRKAIVDRPEASNGICGAARRPTKVAAIALANKLARMAWAMMARNERYKEPAALTA